MRSGYQFDSSFTADDVLSNFPYALPLDLGFDEDSGIYEFPVTIEDEEAPGYAKRGAAGFGGNPCQCGEWRNQRRSSIHSNESKTKAAAEQEMLRQLPDDIGKMDMLSFAKFWSARDRLQWRVVSASSSTAVLELKSQEALTGLTLEFQHLVASVTGGGAVSADRKRIVLPELKPGQTVSLRATYRP